MAITPLFSINFLKQDFQNKPTRDAGERILSICAGYYLSVTELIAIEKQFCLINVMMV